MFAAWLVLLWQAVGLTADGIRGVLHHRSASEAPAEAAFTIDELRRPEGCLLGIYVPDVPAEVRVLENIESRVRRRFVLISIYQAWGSRPEHQFDPRPLNAILARGAVPVLTWEPWVTDFDRRDLPPVPERQFHNLKAIARGDYDVYIERGALAARRWGQPLMVRLAHEMNASWYPWGEQAFGNTAADYWRPFAEMFAPYYDILRARGKPIMIAEIASAEQGGDKGRWITDAMGSLPAEFPQVKAFVWFDVAQDRYWPINWSLTSSTAASRAFRKAAEDPYFIALPR